MKHTFLFLLLILLLGLTACSKPADRTLVYSVVKTYQDLYNDATKLLQKSGIRKNEVIELIYRGFI